MHRLTVLMFPNYSGSAEFVPKYPISMNVIFI